MAERNSPAELQRAADAWGALADTLHAWVTEGREGYGALNQPATVPGPNQPQPGITMIPRR